MAVDVNGSKGENGILDVKKKEEKEKFNKYKWKEEVGKLDVSFAD